MYVHVPENFWIDVKKKKKNNIIEEKRNDENDVHGYFLLFYLELGDTISGFFGGKDNKDDKKPTTDETAQEVSMSCLQCDFILLLTNFFPYLQFSLWVSFSFSFKFILFFLNHHMICLKNQCKLLFDVFFSRRIWFILLFFFLVQLHVFFV